MVESSEAAGNRAHEGGYNVPVNDAWRRAGFPCETCGELGFTLDHDCPNRPNPKPEFCAARDCPNAAIWASPVMPAGASTTFLVPVCREHGTPLSPIHGVVGLDNFMRRKPREWPQDSQVSP